MITFIIALLVLVGGYFLYGSYVERVFGPDKTRKTPALTMADGVDFIPLPTWKIFMIQFLNIAGLGPIFGAIMGAKFGTASYLWIVLGTLFAGAVHDYLSGMLSIRHNGESLPEIIGRYLGLPTKQLMRGFTVVLRISAARAITPGVPSLLRTTWMLRFGLLWYSSIICWPRCCRWTRSSERYIRCSPSPCCLWRWAFW